MVIVDVGANIGYYSLAAASRIGKGGKVFSIEPSPYAATRLERTVRENGLDQVHVARIGLGDVAGQLALGDVPQPDGLVVAGRGEGVAVGAEGDRVHRPSVAAESLKLLAGGEVPELDGVVVAPGRQGLAVRAEGQGVNLVLVPGEAVLRSKSPPPKRVRSLVTCGRRFAGSSSRV